MRLQRFLAYSFVLTNALLGGVANATLTETDYIKVVQLACEGFIVDQPVSANLIEGVTAEQSMIEFRGVEVGERFVYQTDVGNVRLDVISPAGRQPRFVLEQRNRNDSPVLFIAVNGNCELQQIRRLEYQGRSAVALAYLDENLAVLQREALNPAIPDVAYQVIENNATLVAMIDSGVNFLLPDINRKLARDQYGRLLGFDFWDMDELPFDSHISGSPFFVQRHGTKTASLLLQEFEEVSLVSYRYPRGNMQRMSALLDHAHSLGVRIVGIPLGSSRQQDWQEFERAAKRYPEILFVVSAGNNGRNIDFEPIYPASLTLNNMLVVTSADDFGKPAERTNWGPNTVDLLVPAEGINVTDFSGELTQASGSSYAVSRVAALAARLLHHRPTLRTPVLIDEIKKRVVKSDEQRFVKIGYIPDPLDGASKILFSKTSLQSMDGVSFPDIRPMALEIIVLDPEWPLPAIMQAVAEAQQILAQCNIGVGQVEGYLAEGPDYLQVLSSGAAWSVMQAFDRFQVDQTQAIARQDGIKLVFSKDTTMQIQFDAEAFAPGNTRTRPWLTNSVWVAQGAKDLGITLAHELFHVLSNSGEHVTQENNLMNDRTSVDAIELTDAQCQRVDQFFE